MGPVNRKDRLTIILILIIIVMGLEIVYLVYQNRKLSALIEDPRKYFKTLAADEIVPSFAAVDLNGNDIDLRYSPEAPYTMLFWFAPTCASCELNIEFWNRLYREHNTEKLRYVGLCAGNLQEARNFVADFGVEFPAVCAKDAFVIEAYKGNVFPQTMLLSPEGSVMGLWAGALGVQQEDTILTIITQL